MIDLMKAMRFWMGKRLTIDKCPIGLVQSLDIEQHWSGHSTVHIDVWLDHDDFPLIEDYIETKEFFKERGRKS